MKRLELQRSLYFRNFVEISEVHNVRKTYAGTLWLSFAWSNSLGNVFFHRKQDYLVIFAFRHGLISCWNVNNGSFSVAIRYASIAELTICCDITKERKRSGHYRRSRPVRYRKSQHIKLRLIRSQIREEMKRHCALPKTLLNLFCLLSSLTKEKPYILCSFATVYHTV